MRSGVVGVCRVDIQCGRQLSGAISISNQRCPISVMPIVVMDDGPAEGKHGVSKTVQCGCKKHTRGSNAAYLRELRRKDMCASHSLLPHAIHVGRSRDCFLRGQCWTHRGGRTGLGNIRKTPCLLFGAFSTFFMLFMKNVEKAQKSQVLHLPECFLRQSKKYIAFKSISGHKST